MSKTFSSIDYIKQVLLEMDSLIDTRPSTALYDLFIKPQAYLSQPILDDATSIANNQSIANVSTMSEDSADAFASNLYISRLSGDKATGNVRFYFTEPIDIVVPQGTVVLSSTELRFLSVADTEITKESMALNIEGGYYYISIAFIADGYGLSYNASAEDIVSLEGTIDNVVKVSNPNRFSGGLTRETNVQLKERAAEAITVRNLLSSRSMNTQLAQNFAQLKNWLITGYYDPEMARDIVNAYVDGVTYAVHVGGKVDVYLQTSSFTDATADTTATINIPASRIRAISETGVTVSTDVFSDVNADFTEAAISVNDVLQIISGTTAGLYAISSITDSTSLVTTTTIAGTDAAVAYKIYQNSYWNSPVTQITQVDRLDPGTLTASGILLYDGRTVLIDPIQKTALGRDPECTVDSSDAIHYVYEYSDDIWYTKLSNAGNVLVSATNISNSSQVARNPDIACDSSGSIAMVWEEADAVTGAYEIYLQAFDTDGTSTSSLASIMSHAVNDYKDPVISYNDNGLNVAAIYNNTTGQYKLIDDSNHSAELLSVNFKTGATALYTPSIDTDSANAYISLGAGSTSVLVYKINVIGFESFGGVEASEGSGVNTLPSLKVDSSSNVFVAWATDSTSIEVCQLSSTGTIDQSHSKVMTFGNYAKAPRLYIDRSDKIHLVAIEDNENSGDVHYMKFNQNLIILLEDTDVQDQYNNADYIAMVVDSNRRPHILWDSYDNYTASIYYTKRQSQDYRVRSLKQNYRYSVDEIVNIWVDPYFASDYLRFSYEYAHDVSTVNDYVSASESLDRVFCAGYIVKYFIPAFVDVTMTYSGNDTSAAAYIQTYINDNTNYTLAVSDLMSALPLSVSSRVTMPVTITVERHSIDGTIVTTTSTNSITEPRTSRFIARTITVS